MLTDPEKTVKLIREHTKTYIKNNNIQSLVIGVSGGIDSALCAALVRPVCDNLKIALVGYSIPIETNKEDEIVRARNIGKHFCTAFKEIDLTHTYNDIVKGFGIFYYNTTGNIDDKIRLGNLKARIRMMYLYNMAHKRKGMVLSTDNYRKLKYIKYQMLYAKKNYGNKIK